MGVADCNGAPYSCTCIGGPGKPGVPTIETADTKDQLELDQIGLSQIEECYATANSLNWPFIRAHASADARRGHGWCRGVLRVHRAVRAGTWGVVGLLPCLSVEAGQQLQSLELPSWVQ
eukprot:4649253-Prymnesium_polylepis.1